MTDYIPVPEHVERERFTRFYRKYTRPMIGLFWCIFLWSLYDWIFYIGKIKFIYVSAFGIFCSALTLGQKKLNRRFEDVHELFRRNEVVQGTLLEKKFWDKKWKGHTTPSATGLGTHYMIQYEYMNQTYQVPFIIPNENFALMYRSDRYKIPKVGDQLYVYINSDTHAHVYPVTSQLFKE